MWELTKIATFKKQAAETKNLRVFVGMANGDAELKLLHSMLKYNNLFVAQNLSGNMIVFVGDRSLEGRPWVFNITRDKPWVWPEIKFRSKPIEMQTYFIQERNCHTVWDTTGRKNLATKNSPRLAVVPYAVTECISEEVRTTNELRV